MIEIPVSKKLTVKLFESCDEMPMDLYFLAGQYAMMDYEAGSSLVDINKRFEKLDTHIVNNQRDELLQERKNMHQTFFNIVTKVHFPSLQFGCHIYSVNGEKVEDRSIKNFMKLMEQMGKEGFTYKSLAETIDGLKKKMMQELTLMFPDKYSNTAKLNYLSQIKNKVAAELQYILTDEAKYLNEVISVYEYFVALTRPKNLDWNDPQNVVVVAKRTYERLCMALVQTGINAPGQLSVIKFHIAVENYESKRRPKVR